MNFRTLSWVLIAPTLLASCGGDDTPLGGDSDREAFIKVTINGNKYATTYSTNWIEFDDSSVYTQPCDTDAFANAAEVEGLDPDYCEPKSGTEVAFQMQYFNSSYQSVTLDYQGIGFNVHLYEYDEASVDNLGAEVWNSDYYVQQFYIEAPRQALDAQGEDSSDYIDYDPSQLHSITLGPNVAYPSNGSSVSFAFEGQRNFEEGFSEFAVDQLAKQPADTLGDLCDWSAITTDSGDAVYRKVICVGYPLFPLPSEASSETFKYVARIRHTFGSNVPQPDDVVITINSPN